MNKIIIEYQNSGISNIDNHEEVKIIEFNYDVSDTFSTLISYLELSNDEVIILNGGPMYNVFDYIYTEKGIEWDVKMENVKISDFKKTFSNENIKIELVGQGMGAAGGFDPAFISQVLQAVLSELIVIGILYFGKRSIDKIKESSGNKTSLSEKGINDFIKSVSGAREPSIIYDAIYSRRTWTIWEFNEMFGVSDEFSRELLLGMGYQKTKEIDVFLLDYNKKQEFIRKAGLIEKRIIEESQK